MSGCIPEPWRPDTQRTGLSTTLGQFVVSVISHADRQAGKASVPS
jgi:hypothetical protein